MIRFQTGQDLTATGCTGPLTRARINARPKSGNDVDGAAHKLRRHLHKPIGQPASVAVFKGDDLPFQIAMLAQLRGRHSR
jgi:hypothetical protein